MRQVMGYLRVALVLSIAVAPPQPSSAAEEQSGLTQVQQQAMRAVLSAGAVLEPPLPTGPDRQFHFLSIPGTPILLVKVTWYDREYECRTSDRRVWAWRPDGPARIVAEGEEEISCRGSGWPTGRIVTAKELRSILPADFPLARLDYLTLRLRLWSHVEIETSFGEWPERITELHDEKRAVALLGEKLFRDLRDELARLAAMKKQPLGRCMIVTHVIGGILPTAFAACFEPLDGTEASWERKTVAKVQIFGSRSSARLARIENCRPDE